MTSCPNDDDLLQALDGNLPVERTERLHEHIAGCARCREVNERLRTLLADVGAPVPAPLDVRAHTRAVMERLDRRSSEPTRPYRRWVVTGVGWAAACAVAVTYMSRVRGPGAQETLQARGGPVEATIARDVSVRPYAVGDGLQPLMPGAILDGATPLTATFRNLGAAPVFLLLFAVDTAHVVHWISPRYTRSEDNPLATTLPMSVREAVLDTTVVLADVPPGPLRIVAVLSTTPIHVSDVESLQGTELDGAHLLARLPVGTDVRQTIVEVRDGDGGPR